MANFIIRDNSGTVIGRISESGPSCLGCLGVSVIAALIWGTVNLYHVVQSRIANNKIEAQRVTLSPDALDAYTGEYNYKRYKIRIERRGDRLFNKSAEEFCELVPTSAQEFIYKACANGFRGRARFESDPRGKLALVITHQDGRTERADKVE